VKNLFTYIVLISFLLSSSGKLFVLTNFLINQEYIAANLCENIDKPVLKCNGKCHLAKELAKEEKKEKKENKNRYEDTASYILVPIKELYSCEFTPFEKREDFSFILEQKPHGFNASVFHPPTA
jgi:hypothetical protein